MSFYLEGGRKHRKGLRRISRVMRAGKECGKTETIGLTKLVYKLKLKLLELVVIYTYQNNKDETDHKTIRGRNNKRLGCDGVGLIGVIAETITETI